MTNLGGTYDSL